jgi:hypothetical protein
LPKYSHLFLVTPRQALRAVALVFLSAVPALAEVITYSCSFQYRIDEEGKSDELFPLEFKIDTLSGRAFMEGNLGFVDVEIYVGDNAISFTEKVASGAIQTTTITRDGWAVHSRNTVMLGELVAAQHFGRCVGQ